MTINPASLPTVPPVTQDALPQQVTVGELPVGAVQKVGDYKILGTLGSGGMGIVYKAFDQKLGRIVALKMLHIGHEASPEEILRFRGEAETLGRLQHPNIVQVFDFGVHEGSPFLVMEYVNGGSLDKKLAGNPQQPRRAAEWLEQLARAVHSAHEHRVIHRDLKPANVLVTAEGAPKITDFGLAKQMEATHGLTQTGAIMGTPSYMAPEQAEGKKDVGPQADVYSLGAILYECLTGRPPFRGATLQETLEQVCNADPAPPSRLVPRLPRDLQTICLKCLEKAPGRRYHSALDLADDLRSWLEGLPVKARPTHSLERIIRYVARRPLRFALAGVSLLVVGLTIVLLLVLRDMRLKDAAAQQQLAYERALNDQKERVAQARRATEDARKSLQHLKDMLALTMNGDLNTPAGLDRLEKKLQTHAAELHKSGGDGDKAMVLAGAFVRLGVLWRELGETDRASNAYNEAEALARPAEGAGPGELDIRMQRARVYQGRGLLRCETLAEEAVKDCHAALALLGDGKEEGTANREYLRLRAETLHDLAVATSNLIADTETARRKRDEEAQKAYREALALLRPLAAQPDASDEDSRNLARTLGYLGDLYLDMGLFQEADAAYWESHLLREKLARDKPRHYERKYQLARSWDNIGGYQTRQRILNGATYFYRHSLELRRELHKKQPDNKEYALELTGVLNRIAELELFIAEQESADVKRLTQAEDLLRECSGVLVGLLGALSEDSATEKNTATRTYSRLGECHSLQARSAMLRLALTDRKEALEEARAAARAAGDDYAKVKDRRRLTKEELYQQAAAQVLSLEIYLATRGENVKNPTGFYDQPAKMLSDSLGNGFRRLAAEEIARDRAFRSVVGKDWFVKLLELARSKPEGKSTAMHGSGKDS